MRGLACFFVLVCAAVTASADGGRVRMQQASGNFIITLFTMPEPLTTGDADFSVLVQDRATQQVLLDAAVALRLTAPSGEVQLVPLSSGYVGNRMLQAADPESWRQREVGGDGAGESRLRPGREYDCLRCRSGSLSSRARTRIYAAAALRDCALYRASIPAQ